MFIAFCCRCYSASANAELFKSRRLIANFLFVNNSDNGLTFYGGQGHYERPVEFPAGSEGVSVAMPSSGEPLDVLLRRLFPGLSIDDITPLDEGWDSSAVLVNDSMVFKIPKRPEVAQQMVKEIRVLKAVRSHVSVQIPNILWIGRKSGSYPVSALGYPKLSGIPLSDMKSGPVREAALEQVGRFLTELHAVPTGVLRQIQTPSFQWTGVSPGKAAASWEEGLHGFLDRIVQHIVPLLDGTLGNRVTEFISNFLSCPHFRDFEPVLIHGDLAPDHVLVEPQTGVVSIIDFGDCGLGDPAYDVWAEAMPWYRGAMDGGFRERQRFYKQLAPFHAVMHGQATGNSSLVGKGLEQVASEFAATK